jgi:hypothetical protein
VQGLGSCGGVRARERFVSVVCVRVFVCVPSGDSCMRRTALLLQFAWACMWRRCWGAMHAAPGWGESRVIDEYMHEAPSGMGVGACLVAVCGLASGHGRCASCSTVAAGGRCGQPAGQIIIMEISEL